MGNVSWSEDTEVAVKRLGDTRFNGMLLRFGVDTRDGLMLGDTRFEGMLLRFGVDTRLMLDGARGGLVRFRGGGGGGVSCGGGLHGDMDVGTQFGGVIGGELGGDGEDNF